MFKVGDKVCDPVYGWNGYIYAIESGDNYPIFVQFENGESFAYTFIGSASTKESTQRLFDGHMEPGTGKLTFTPKKEPVYEWQWLIRDTNQNSFFASCHHEDINAIYSPEVVLCRIEESKREAKS